MKFLNLSLAGLMLRFYLMMLIVIIAGFTHMWILSVLALPILLSALMGVQFKRKSPHSETGKSGQYTRSTHQHQPAQ